MQLQREPANVPRIEPDPPVPTSPPAVPQRRNYYRRIARARVSWAVVAVLSLLWLAGLVFDYLEDYSDPETTEYLTLVQLDRTLRLAEVLETSPPFLQWIFAFEGREPELRYAARGLRELLAEGHESEDLSFALAVMLVELGEEIPPGLAIEDDEYLDLLQHGTADEETAAELAAHMQGDERSAWAAMLLRRAGTELPPEARHALARYERENERLFRRLLVASLPGATALVAGLVLLPHMLLWLRKRSLTLRAPARIRYPDAWHVSLVIALLVGMDLFADAFQIVTYELAWLLEPGFGYHIVIDLAWRILPVAAALLLLFRRPGPALRSLGLTGPVHWRLVAATFALLFAFERLLWALAGQWVAPDPTGGLNPMEFGVAGLIYGLVAACVVAPVCEEIVYRGLLLRGLRKPLGFLAAALVSSGIFAAVHFYDWYGTLCVGVFGFAAACLYRATGSLLAAVSLHALFNLTITLPMWSIYYMEL